MYTIGNGHIGPHLYICVLMDVESRYIVAYAYGKSNSEKLKKQVMEKVGIAEMPPASRLVSAFFGSLMSECIYMYDFEDNEQRKTKVDDWIHYYNHERGHSSLNYRIPCEVYNQGEI